MLILTLLLGLLFYAIYKRHQQMTTFQKLRIPGPKPNFIFGNLIDIAREGLKGVFPKWTKKYGPIVGFYLGGNPQLLITDFELMRRIMIKDFNKFSNKSQSIPVIILISTYQLNDTFVTMRADFQTICIFDSKGRCSSSSSIANDVSLV